MLDLVTNSLTSLLQAQPALLDMIPAMGYIQGFVNQLSNKKHETVPKSSLLILHQLSGHPACVETMIGSNTLLSQVLSSMKSYQTLTDIACEALNKMFQSRSDELVHQAIKAELIQYLLRLLDSAQSNYNSSTRAQIVQVLKAMRQNLTYGQQVDALLDKSTVWSEYRDQLHDLFITNTPIAGSITCK